MPHILVVEDNLTNQKVVAGLLRKHGYDILVANHGRQALEALGSHAFDLVVMDLQMPVLDGLETTRIIRKNPAWSALPVIGLTAHAMPGDRARCLEAGMNEYLAKPVPPAVLYETVARCLEGPPGQPTATSAAVSR